MKKPGAREAWEGKKRRWHKMLQRGTLDDCIDDLGEIMGRSASVES